jgi:hypothetical protein
LEEEMGRVGLERQVAELVDDQELWFGEARQAILQAALAMSCRNLDLT